LGAIDIGCRSDNHYGVDFYGQPFFWGYAAVMAIMLGVGLTLELKGSGGKIARAMMIAALTGLGISQVVYFAYPHFIPPPVAPHLAPTDPNNPSKALADAFTGLVIVAAQAAGYAAARVIAAFGYGILGMVAAFALSFLIPHSAREKLAPPA
jgi:hypothetical protein